MRISLELGKLFGLPPVKASLVKVTRTADGYFVEPYDRFMPVPAAAPMGFSWSLYFAQRGGEHILVARGGFRMGRILTDRTPPAVLGDTPHWYLYVDNLGIIGSCRAAVVKMLQEARVVLEEVGLLTHETRVSDHDVVTLGAKLDLDRFTTTLTDTRYWLLERSLMWLEAAVLVEHWILECLLGRCTFAGLMCRPSL